MGELGSILGVWAHPDDEAYLSAGLMATAVDAGQRVVCVTATRGEAGFPPNDPRPVTELASLRVAELEACLEIIGVSEHRFLGYSDGRCATVDDAEAAAAVLDVINEVRPDTVLTFGPTGGTGHPDHIAACRWSTLAVDQLEQPPRLLYSTKSRSWVERFLADRPEGVLMVEDLQPEGTEESDLAVHFTCTGELLARKVAALSAQASQVESFRTMLGPEGFADLVAEEFFRVRRPDDRAVTLPNARR